jgi:hypothetical protein
MDDLFGVTELAKKMEDEEGAHDIPPAKDFEGEKTQHVEVSQVNSDTKHWRVFCGDHSDDGNHGSEGIEWVMIMEMGLIENDLSLLVAKYNNASLSFPCSVN